MEFRKCTGYGDDANIQLYNMNDPVDDGPACCSDTLSIVLTGLGGGNMRADITFTSGFPEGNVVPPLSCDSTPDCTTELASETVNFSCAI
jgi:hypothetical protein